MVRVLLISGSPLIPYYEEAFRKYDIPFRLKVILRENLARKCLIWADSIDIVFMDHDLGLGTGRDTIRIGLVRAFVEAGFGNNKKMLVANSRDQHWNKALVDAGCNLTASPHNIERFVGRRLRSILIH